MNYWLGSRMGEIMLNHRPQLIVLMMIGLATMVSFSSRNHNKEEDGGRRLSMFRPLSSSSPSQFSRLLRLGTGANNAMGQVKVGIFLFCYRMWVEPIRWPHFPPNPLLPNVGYHIGFIATLDGHLGPWSLWSYEVGMEAWIPRHYLFKADFYLIHHSLLPSNVPSVTTSHSCLLPQDDLIQAQVRMYVDSS